ncbi:MAG: aldo/keto reductase [Solirubrobacterales bacterium]|nr:aldo/keto reductase [Solirubrobacterales bacterium]
MQMRTLGDSGIEVSEIALGSWLTYSGGIERDQTEACTRAAFDAGITFFDTANVYGNGAAESAWGEILKQYPRDSYVLATKLFAPIRDGHAGGLAAGEVHAMLEESLERLQTDYVDLYQCHRPDPNTPIEETMEALSDVVRAGKVRAIGFSEWTPEQIQAALDVPGTVKFVSSQPQYHMLWRGPEEEVFGLCAENGISQIVWSPIAQGVLAGKYKPGEPVPEDSRAASGEMGNSIQRFFKDEDLLVAVQRLAPIADEAGITMAQLAIAWTLRRPELAAAIVGASRPEQVHANAAASGIALEQDVLDAIDEALGDHVVREPQLAYGAQPGVKHR